LRKRIVCHDVGGFRYPQTQVEEAGMAVEVGITQNSVWKSLSPVAPDSAHGRALLTLIAHDVRSQIHSMRGALRGFANAANFVNLEHSVIASLGRIERLIVEGKIKPQAKVRHSVEGKLHPPVDRELRIGLFPTAANPFHWAHLLGGLVAMERFLLDKVIFVIAGQDSRKPEMAPEVVRHSMAKKVVQLFHPLFEYSSIAFGKATTGEENLFNIFGMNPYQAIHAFYIAGGDHYHRFNPATGAPDTIQKLENGMTSKLYGFDEQLHRVSAVFLRRESEDGDITTFLDVRRVRMLPVQTSSTEIRRAFEDRRRWWKLYALPFVELDSICDNRLYNGQACKELLDERHGKVIEGSSFYLRSSERRGW
jgi:nicotinic acid mononucleotide adenylyltransferase